MKKYCYFSILILLFASTISLAGQVTNNLSVSTQVTANCSISSGTLSFGNYNPIGINANTSLDGLATFQIACTKGSNVSVTLNNGVNSGNATGTTRAMTDGRGHFLSYELYSDPGRSMIWGISNPIIFIPAISTPTTKTVYGRIPAGQNQMGGYYTDTVTITAAF